MKTLICLQLTLVASIATAGDWKGHEAILMDHPTIVACHRIQTEHRKRNGLRPQTLNGELCRVAQEWSEFMARTGSFSHSPYNVAENIATGSRSASGTMDQWIGSRGHNANLLSGGSQVGFGVAESPAGQRYWTSCHGSGFKIHKRLEGE